MLRGGRPIPLPLSPFAFLTTPLFSAGAKLSLLREPFVAASAPDAQETVAQFVRSRLCQEFLDYAINPFVAGVYAGDPERLSVRAAFPRLFELEQKHGSLIRGQIAGARERKRNPEKSKQSAPMLSFRDGMQTMPDAIAGKLRRLLLGTRAAGLARHPQGGWDITADSSNGALRVRARTVVLAVPPVGHAVRDRRAEGEARHRVRALRLRRHRGGLARPALRARRQLAAARA